MSRVCPPHKPLRAKGPADETARPNHAPSRVSRALGSKPPRICIPGRAARTRRADPGPLRWWRSASPTWADAIPARALTRLAGNAHMQERACRAAFPPHRPTPAADASGGPPPPQGGGIDCVRFRLCHARRERAADLPACRPCNRLPRRARLRSFWWLWVPALRYAPAGMTIVN